MRLATVTALLVGISLLVRGQDSPLTPQSGPTDGPPNILFIIMDDVGIDQLGIFNPMADVVPDTPNIDTLAAQGIRFTDFWSMPECSPARACFFTGRYPLRTGVTNVILDNDLPFGQVSPFETTVPRVLDTAGYKSALIGKFHLGDNNPAGNRSPAALGWDYFDGILAGVPPDIDTTVGGQTDTVYSCGFPTGAEPIGACWFEAANGMPMCVDAGGALTALDCLTMGGIPALDADGNVASSCADAVGPPDFSSTNGYYVWPKTTSNANGARDSLSREYLTIDQTDAAISWIQRRSGPGARRPWMCTVSYNAPHTPYQQPPASLTPGSLEQTECASETAQRELNDLMIEAMDKEVGRLLVETGLASWDRDQLELHLDAANTAIVLVGDNGSYYPVVKDPYNPGRSKGTCFQTGVWCPLVVAGPSDIVVQPGRAVDHMTNGVDLFELFGELAGVDVRDVVPPSHVLDSHPMLAYLTDPNQSAIRQFNFSQIGLGAPAPQESPGPCVLIDGISCDDILFTTKDLCEANDGTWYGEGTTAADMPFADCCELRESGRVSQDLVILPKQAWTIRNEEYKLFMFEQACCNRGRACTRGPECPEEQGAFLNTYALYRLDGDPPLDNADDNLLDGSCPCDAGLTDEEWENFLVLQQALEMLLASEIQCHGDGNLDKRVNVKDLVGVMQDFGVPSVFDVNFDGTTDQLDRACVLANMGNVCATDNPGVQCEGTVGACCVASGSCEIMTESDCQTAGGVYQGDGTHQCCSGAACR